MRRGRSRVAPGQFMSLNVLPNALTLLRVQLTFHDAIGFSNQLFEDGLFGYVLYAVAPTKSTLC